VGLVCKDAKFVTISGRAHRVGRVAEFGDNLKLGHSSLRYFSKRPLSMVNQRHLSA